MIAKDKAKDRRPSLDTFVHDRKCHGGSLKFIVHCFAEDEVVRGPTDELPGSVASSRIR